MKTSEMIKNVTPLVVITVLSVILAVCILGLFLLILNIFGIFAGGIAALVTVVLYIFGRVLTLPGG